MEQEGLCNSCFKKGNNVMASCACVECDRMMCDACAGQHSRIAVFRSHQIIKRVAKATGALCPEHQEPLQYTCTECRKNLCSDCTLSSEHEAHPEKITELQDVPDEQTKGQVDQIVAQVQACKEGIQKDFNTAKVTEEEIDKLVQALEEKLKQAKGMQQEVHNSNLSIDQAMQQSQELDYSLNEAIKSGSLSPEDMQGLEAAAQMLFSFSYKVPTLAGSIKAEDINIGSVDTKAVAVYSYQGTSQAFGGPQNIERRSTPPVNKAPSAAPRWAGAAPSGGGRANQQGAYQAGVAKNVLGMLAGGQLGPQGEQPGGEQRQPPLPSSGILSALFGAAGSATRPPVRGDQGGPRPPASGFGTSSANQPRASTNQAVRPPGSEQPRPSGYPRPSGTSGSRQPPSTGYPRPSGPSAFPKPTIPARPGAAGGPSKMQPSGSYSRSGQAAAGGAAYQRAEGTTAPPPGDNPSLGAPIRPPTSGYYQHPDSAGAVDPRQAPSSEYYPAPDGEQPAGALKGKYHKEAESILDYLDDKLNPFKPNKDQEGYPGWPFKR